MTSHHGDLSKWRGLWVRGCLVASLLLMVGFLDYATGTKLGFSIFYLFPIFFATALLGIPAGYAAAALSSACWLLVEASGIPGQGHWGVLLWNAGIRFCFFMFGVLLLRLRQVNASEHALRRFAEDSSRLKAGISGLIGPEVARAMLAMREDLEQLKASDPTSSFGQRSRHYRNLEKTLSHLTSAAEGFLVWNRLDSPHFTIKLEGRDADTVGMQALAVLKPLLQDKAVLIHFDGSSRASRLPRIRDLEAFDRVLRKLIQAALESAAPGRTLYCRLIEYMADPDHASLFIETGRRKGSRGNHPSYDPGAAGMMGAAGEYVIHLRVIRAEDARVQQDGGAALDDRGGHAFDLSSGRLT